MYQVFDGFLAMDTWHTRHALDERRFFEALSSVVKDSNFDPEKMGEYFRQKTRSTIHANDNKHPFEHAIAHYVAAAWAVKDYLAATHAR
jgi:hypothetical protein